MAIPLVDAFRNHPRIWRIASAADPAVFEIAVELAAFALSRPPGDVPDFFKTVALKSAEDLNRRVQRRLAQKGGSARKADALTMLIEKMVLVNPRIPLSEVLKELTQLCAIREVVQDIDDDEISFLNHDGKEKTIKIAGLKDRLSRAKKKFQSR